MMLLRIGTVGNLLMDYTVPDCSLCIKSVLFENECWTDLAEDETGGENFKEDTVT